VKRPELRLVVLCAGASARLGQPKALAALGPAPEDRALLRLLSAARALGDPNPLVVSGAEHERLCALLPAGVECVRNEAWRAGRTGSLQHALAHRPGADVCLAPIDVPRVPAEVFAALAQAWHAHGAPEEGWLAPWVPHPEGPRHGHPVVIGRALLAHLKDFPPDRPLRALRALARPRLELEVASATILDDLDTPADLERLRTDGTTAHEFPKTAQDP
jgi:CTP:molybdopterin cytidylyltransferase MocA